MNYRINLVCQYTCFILLLVRLNLHGLSSLSPTYYYGLTPCTKDFTIEIFAVYFNVILFISSGEACIYVMKSYLCSHFVTWDLKII